MSSLSEMFSKDRTGGPLKYQALPLRTVRRMDSRFDTPSARAPSDSVGGNTPFEWIVGNLGRGLRDGGRLTVAIPSEKIPFAPVDGRRF
jgi:hypothetical protein